MIGVDDKLGLRVVFPVDRGLGLGDAELGVDDGAKGGNAAGSVVCWDHCLEFHTSINLRFRLVIF